MKEKELFLKVPSRFPKKGTVVSFPRQEKRSKAVHIRNFLFCRGVTCIISQPGLVLGAVLTLEHTLAIPFGDLCLKMVTTFVPGKIEAVFCVVMPGILKSRKTMFLSWLLDILNTNSVLSSGAKEFVGLL